jgi:glycosyltransferase involved in cell wall biosynthesis
VKLAFDWDASSYFGWGVYGINLALECAKRGVETTCTNVVRADQLALDPLRLKALAPFIKRSNSQQRLPRDAVLFHTLGNEMMVERPRGCRIGVVFFEQPLSPMAIKRAREYDLIIAGSTWNADILKSLRIETRFLIQGVDRSLFHPGPRRDLFPGRFLIFSGGKAEPRKGQDIVAKAFRIFAKRHSDAMLIAAWHSPWPQLADGMDLDLSDLAGQVIDIGAVPNSRMAGIYRECHVGLFPNRIEGGTNLVAMELIACGIPAIVSANTGHLDLLRLTGARPVYPMPGTGEPDIEHILDNLERAYGGDLAAGRDELPGWDHTAAGLIEAAAQIGASE